MLTATVLAALCTPTLIETLDVRYYPGKDRHVLDVFRQDGGGPRPVVLFVHGGTWMMGDKNFYGINRKAAQMFARAGYVTAVMNYRLSPFVKHPEHARDVARAFAWVQRSITKYGGDPTRVILVGHSAGGHLAALVASDPAYLADPELALSACSRAALKGVVGVSGVYRIPQADEFQKRIASAVIDGWMEAASGPAALSGPLLSVLGPTLDPFRMVFGPDPAVAKKASPVSHVRKGLPPFLLLYSEREPPTLPEMAMEFGARLLENGVAAEVRSFEGCNHRTIVSRLHNETDVVSRRVLEFIGNRVR